MLNLFRRIHLNRFLLSVSLSSFAITQSFPIYAVPQINGQNIAAMVRLERVIEKFLKSKKKGNKEIISCLKDVKKEIETSFGLKFNMDQCLNMVKDEVRRNGVAVPDKKFDTYRNMLKSKKIIAKGHKNDKQDQEEKEMSSYLVFGVTCSLVGFFLMCTRIPVLVTWGERLVTMGVGACAKSLSDANDENNKKKKEEEERDRQRNQNQPNWV